MEGLSSGGNMTHWRESLMEAARPIALLTSKTTTKIATWNIRTTYEVGKAVQMAAQMNNYKISLLDLCDTRWTQTGQVRLSTGETLCTQATRKRKPPSPPPPPPSTHRRSRLVSDKEGTVRTHQLGGSQLQTDHCNVQDTDDQHQDWGSAMLRSHKWCREEEGGLLKQAPGCAGQAQRKKIWKYWWGTSTQR